MTILKEDYMRRCDRCKQTGRIKVTHEWGMGEKTDHYEICPKCKGTKIYLDIDECVSDLKHRIKELEEDE